jgi:hypothetical protein
MWYPLLESLNVIKFPKLIEPVDFSPWAVARFHSHEGRDRFLDVFATLETSDVEVESMPGEERGAMVRWRPGKLLGLNDVAYAHGGRIVFPAMRRRRLT